MTLSKYEDKGRMKHKFFKSLLIIFFFLSIFNTSKAADDDKTIMEKALLPAGWTIGAAAAPAVPVY